MVVVLLASCTIWRSSLLWYTSSLLWYHLLWALVLRGWDQVLPNCVSLQSYTYTSTAFLVYTIILGFSVCMLVCVWVCVGVCACMRAVRVCVCVWWKWDVWGRTRLVMCDLCTYKAFSFPVFPFQICESVSSHSAFYIRSILAGGDCNVVYTLNVDVCPLSNRLHTNSKFSLSSNSTTVFLLYIVCGWTRLACTAAVFKLMNPQHWYLY